MEQPEDLAVISMGKPWYEPFTHFTHQFEISVRHSLFNIAISFFNGHFSVEWNYGTWPHPIPITVELFQRSDTITTLIAGTLKSKVTVVGSSCGFLQTIHFITPPLAYTLLNQPP